MKQKILVILASLNLVLIILNGLGGPDNDWLIYVQGAVTIPIIIIPFTFKKEKNNE